MLISSAGATLTALQSSQWERPERLAAPVIATRCLLAVWSDVQLYGRIASAVDQGVCKVVFRMVLLYALQNVWEVNRVSSPRVSMHQPRGVLRAGGQVGVWTPLQLRRHRLVQLRAAVPPCA